MKKTSFSFFIMSIIFLVLAGVAVAKGSNAQAQDALGAGQKVQDLTMQEVAPIAPAGERLMVRAQDGTGTGTQGEIEEVGAGNATMEQNLVKTQNAGEDSQLRVETTEVMQAGAGSSSRSDQARQSMSKVANEVKALLASPDRKGGIGLDIREIAKAQQAAQSKMGANLENLSSKSRIAKFFFGADSEAVVKVREDAQMIAQRLEQLKEMQTEVTDPEAQENLAAMISSLEAQQLNLEKFATSEEFDFSLFGWVRRMFRGR